MFGFAFSEEITSSFTLIILLFLFCKIWCSVAFDVIAVLNLFQPSLNLSQSFLNSFGSLQQYHLRKPSITTPPPSGPTPSTPILILLTITTQRLSPLPIPSPSPLNSHPHDHLYYHLNYHLCTHHIPDISEPS